MLPSSIFQILHEPLQELLNLYPDWLEKNKDHPKFSVYTKQCQIVQEICDIFNGTNSQVCSKMHGKVGIHTHTPMPITYVTRITLLLAKRQMFVWV